MEKKEKSHEVVRYIIAGILLIFLASGCGSITLPKKLKKSQLNEIQNIHFPVTVAVYQNQYMPYEETLAVLQKTKLFDEVQYESQLPDADLIAYPARVTEGIATIPILTGLSLGIIPTIVDEKIGVGFDLRKKGAEQGVYIEYSYQVQTFLGWFGFPLVVLPDRCYCEPYYHDRFIQQVSHAIYLKREEIISMLDEQL